MQPSGCLSDLSHVGVDPRPQIEPLHYCVMAGFGVLRQYLSERAAFAPEEFSFMETVFLPRNLKSEEFLQRAGEVAAYATFVATGCLRSYVVDSNGEEHMVQLAAAPCWLADSISLGGRTPSQYFYQAIEDSELLLIDPLSHQMLVQRIPSYAASFQFGPQPRSLSKE